MPFAWDADAMLTRAGTLIDDFAGGTRLATSLRTLRRLHARQLVGRRTVVLLVTDGLDTDEPAALVEDLQWLNRHVRGLLWLNPMLLFDGYEPTEQRADVLNAYADSNLTG